MTAPADPYEPPKAAMPHFMTCVHGFYLGIHVTRPAAPDPKPQPADVVWGLAA